MVLVVRLIQGGVIFLRACSEVHDARHRPPVATESVGSNGFGWFCNLFIARGR